MVYVESLPRRGEGWPGKRTAHVQRPCGRKGAGLAEQAIKCTDQDKESALSMPDPQDEKKRPESEPGRGCLCSDRGPRSLPPSTRPAPPTPAAFPEATPILAARSPEGQSAPPTSGGYSRPSASCRLIRGGDQMGGGACANTKGQKPTLARAL